MKCMALWGEPGLQGNHDYTGSAKCSPENQTSSHRLVETLYMNNQVLEYYYRLDVQ